MKVRISTTVNIDPEKWAQEFSLDPDDKSAIRQDVRDYFERGCEEQLLSLGLEEET